ncbi:MAG: prepilin peptidase [Betaproteobacteria bacterium]|nr:A24 family peptidase [Pseudomonadota bacterium]NBQ09346.1 prepilin peptidase [Betaproteobacteria bacterium]NBS20331.1 prepilin peptidase [Betaproteobacteria bacterium]NCZ47523.1 prepilin peptidase [Betaproteobacteria bacterium]NDA04856.1 prepilin peptidase [Betaproteobacteria bacterium]
MQWNDWIQLATEQAALWQLAVAALVGWLVAFPLARLTRALPEALFNDWDETQAEAGAGLVEGAAGAGVQDPGQQGLEVISPHQAESLKGWRFSFFSLGPIAVAVLALSGHGLVLEAAAICLLGWTLWVLAWIDIETRLLPDVLTQALLWAGLLINCAEYFTSLDQAVMGAAAGYGSLWLLNAVYRALRGTDGMGAGDFKLLAAIGAWLGLTALPAVVLIAASTGVLTGLLLGLIGWRSRGEAIAFGPHLCLGAAVMVFGEQTLRPLLYG